MSRRVVEEFFAGSVPDTVSRWRRKVGLIKKSHSRFRYCPVVVDQWKKQLAEIKKQQAEFNKIREVQILDCLKAKEYLLRLYCGTLDESFLRYANVYERQVALISEMQKKELEWDPVVVAPVKIPLSNVGENQDPSHAIADMMSRISKISHQAQTSDVIDNHGEGPSSSDGFGHQEGGVDARGSTPVGGSVHEEVDARGTTFFDGLDTQLPVNLVHERAGSHGGSDHQLPTDSNEAQGSTCNDKGKQPVIGEEASYDHGSTLSNSGSVHSSPPQQDDARGSTSYGGFRPPMNLNTSHDEESDHDNGNTLYFQVGIDQPSTDPDHISIYIGETEQILQRQWNSYIITKKQVPMGSRVLSEPTMQVIAQAAGAALGSSIEGSSWAKQVVYATTLVGFGFTFAGVGTRHAMPKFATVVSKVGAVASASAVIVGLATALPAVVAWPAGIAAGLGVAASVMFADFDPVRRK